MFSFDPHTLSKLFLFFETLDVALILVVCSPIIL